MGTLLQKELDKPFPYLFSSSFFNILIAPLGHFFTCSNMASVEAANGSIHGLLLGSNTGANPLKQIPVCWQIDGLQTMVISPLVYFIVS